MLSLQSFAMTKDCHCRLFLAVPSEKPLTREKILPKSFFFFLLHLSQIKKTEIIASGHIHAAKEKRSKYMISFSSALRERLGSLKKIPRKFTFQMIQKVANVKQRWMECGQALPEK